MIGRGAGTRAALAFALIAGSGGCRVEDRQLNDRVYPCDSDEPKDQCGTGENGMMTCYRAKVLDGQDFCAEACDKTGSSPQGRQCLSAANALLSTCSPGGEGPRAECPHPGLSCLRTNVLADEGLCLAVDTCDDDVDCSDSLLSRRTCMSTLLRELYGEGAGLETDHLYCVKEGCTAGSFNCESYEVCLPGVVPRSSSPPDICVPKCSGASLSCPPNHFCWAKVSGPPNPEVCIPGLLGFGCSGNEDCLMGVCLLGGEQRGVCSVRCETDSDCAVFRARGGFVCRDVGFPGVGKFCINPVSLGGTSCAGGVTCDDPEDPDDDGFICTNRQPILSPGEQPHECRRACESSDDCPPFLGITHTCALGTCFPGRFGVGCQADTDCVEPLRCLSAPSIDRVLPTDPPSICSFPCAGDADCDEPVLAEQKGRCAEGVCRRVREPDVPCERDDQCLSRRCVSAGLDGTEMRCR